MAKWLDKYEQGGLVLKKKTKDNYGKKPNVNDVKVSAGPGFEGDGYTAQNWKSPAWGGQFQNGGIVVNDSNDPRLKKYQDSLTAYNKSNDLYKQLLKQGKEGNEGTREQVRDKMSLKEVNYRGSVGMPYSFEGIKPDYILGTRTPTENRGYLPHYKQPTQPVKYQAPKTEVKTVKGSKKYFINETEVDEPTFNKIVPKKEMAMGGGIPGAVGFTYARTAGSAPANGKYTKKTLASAQDGKVLSPDADDRSLLGFDTSDPAFQNVKANAFVPFDRKDFEGIRQNMAGYMNSPLYMERLSKSIPDTENAKDVQQRRLDNLLSIKLNPKTVNEGTNYNHNQNRINIGARDFVDNSIIGHELAHGVVPNITNSYGKQNMFAKATNVIGDLFQPFEQFSNSELEKINRPLSGKITAPNFDYMMARKEEHYKPQGSKASAKTAANETYGDLTGMRQLLLDNGLTTEFGQELTPELFKKATENKRVMNSPAFKRMKLKFKDEDIIKMNNEVAMNDNKKDIPQAQLGVQLMPYLLSSAASVAASIPTMEEVKKKAINVIKDSPKLRSALNSGLSYVANTDWGKEKIKNFANNIDPHGYGNGYVRNPTTKSPFDRIYSAAVLNKKEDSRKEMDSLLAAGKADPGDSLRVDLINQYAGLPQKYNTLKPSVYKPTMGNKNDKYYSSPIVERQLLSDIDLVAGNVKMKPEFKTKQDLQNFVQKYFGGEKGKGNNYVTPIEGLGTATTGVGEDEKGIYLSYYDNWDLNPYHGNFADSDNSFEATNDKLGRAILGNEKENVATKKIGTPTQVYGRIYFDKKTGKPKMKKGGVIKDDMGQWAHPGEVTEIDSNDITMQGVDYPVLGISDTGDTKMMYPDQDYKFDGDKVTEFPMMEAGGWLDKYKAQSGKTAAPYGSLQGDLPEVVVTSTKPSKWGKFKFAPYDPSKNPESISQWNPKPGEREAMAAAEQARRDEENSWYNNKHIKSFRNSAFMDPKALAIGTAAALIGPEVIPYVGAALETPIVAGLTANHLLGAAAVTHGINQLPETAQSVRTAYNNPNYENVVNAINDVGWNALDIAPVAPVAKTASQEVKAAINASKESGLLSNTYKVNPFAFKPKSDAYYRMVGEGGYADALESGVVRPPVGSGHTEAYYNKGYPLDTRLRDATGRAGYGGPYMAEVKGDPELFVNENVANYTGPMFDDPVVYSKQNIPINNPNLKFYKEDWLRGYKEVPKPTGSEATQNIFIPKPIDDIFKSVGSYYQEKLGETFAGAKNRAAIKEGNEWFQNWIDNPLTKNKIKNQIIDQQLLGKRAPLVSDRINDPKTMQDWGYLTSYRAGAKEYPLVYQKNDLIDFLKGHKRYNTPMIHADNWGVSYRHGQPYSWDTQQIYSGDRTSGGGTWVSRSLDIPQVARTSTTVHENTHDWLRDQTMERLGYKDLILKNMNQDAATNWADFSIHRDVGKNPIGYLADPTEVHARIMEARKHFGLTPGEYVTEERAKDIIERIGKGRSPISRRFPEIFDNPKQTAYLFNRLPAVAPVAVGVGAGALATQAGSDKQKNGGWLNKYK